MILIIASIILGFLGFYFGGMVGPEFFMYLFGIAGFFAPSLYVLEQIYKEVKNKGSEQN